MFRLHRSLNGVFGFYWTPPRFGLSIGRLGLNGKILLIVTGASVAGALVTVLLLLLIQFEQSTENIRILNQRLISVVQADMLHRSGADSGNVLAALAQEMQVEGVRLVDTQGTVYFSTHPDEVGTRPDVPELREQFPLDPYAAYDGPTSVVQFHADHRHLASIAVIHNEPACHACHAPENQVLGLVVVETPLRRIGEMIRRSAWRALLVTTTMFILLTGLLTFFLRRLILQPLTELRRGAAAVAAGNLDHPVTLSSQDELGELAQDFEEMRQHVKTSHIVMARQNQELRLLNELGAQVSASLELGQVLATVAEGARQLLAADIGVVGLWDEKRQGIQIETAAGVDSARLQHRFFPLPHSRNGTTIRIEQCLQANMSGWCSKELEALGIVSVLAVPLYGDDHLLGVLGVMMRRHRRFTTEDQDFLRRLAYQVVTAVENARLYQQARYMAAMTEQHRLGQEMHDRLAQSLGYLNMRVSAITATLCCEQIDQVQSDLMDLRQVVGETYTDVREAIFNLRRTVSTSPDIVATIATYLDDYRTHYELHAELVLDGLDSIVVLPEVGIQLLRIVQEALTNARKHAQAQHVWVRIEQAANRLRIIIEDDGRGWDPATCAGGGCEGFGLQIMDERARSVGGHLRLKSAPDEGSQIVVEVPLDTKGGRL